MRWRVCALLLAATTINYVDRQVLGVLAPFLQTQIGWNEIQYGYIVTAFQAAYALGLLCSGAVIDRFVTRVGYALAIGIWSLAAMGHALATSVVGFAIARFFLGLGESGNFPAALKTVAEWFPRRERALATGIFNSGSNIGAIVAPLLVPVIATAWGWQAAFLFTGVLSTTWLLVWWLSYHPPERQPGLSAAELAHIRSDAHEPVQRRLSWLQVLRHRQAWAFVLGKFITDPIWWFFLFWLPKFLHAEYGLSLLQLGARLERQPCAQDRDADLRHLGGADRVRRTRRQSMGRGRSDRLGHRRASGLVGQPVYATVGHVSAPCGRHGGRYRWLCRRGGWHADRYFHRVSVAGHRQLRAGVLDGGLGLPAGVDGRAHAGATPGSSAAIGRRCRCVLPFVLR
ncbi:Sialic acid transporter NanT [Xanthomonas hydrangeae]|nr:Sialic acid transporter NanT [Xanthomonas hydrangeae]CAD7730302.1 Sialic acid transporter NanT [Xanthomonas hydrangeae]CAD7745474.1 Sialic acid transporter NanT [Xanthomonas hydrangeae]CAD7745477.1 Sialic acid transporter NanT [Xanthomonas hydrangeae]